MGPLLMIIVMALPSMSVADHDPVKGSAVAAVGAAANNVSSSAMKTGRLRCMAKVLQL
jgi:hypothetical protein